MATHSSTRQPFFMMKPLCFVVMPFGKKKDADGLEINFDLVYTSLIHPAIEAADMEPIRADEETVNGIIHKPMYERLILCDYAVADLTTANANVFYELGIRHAVKPYSTVTIFADGSRLPFDLNFIRCQPYTYSKDTFFSNEEKLKKDIANLSAQLQLAKINKVTDSPVYQLVDGISFQNSVAHQKTDIFRDMVEYDVQMKQKLRRVREGEGSSEEKIAAVDAVAATFKPENVEAGVLIDVMLSYRSLEAYDKMIDFIDKMPAHVRQTVMVQEQLGFAYNRVKKREEAIAVLEKVIKDNKPSSETNGILGRVFKDLYDKALNENNEILSESYLDKALETYTKGFEADWRDAYPGVNALTLLEIKGEADKVTKLAPVVEYAVLRKIATKGEDYWDYATLVEIAVLQNDLPKAKEQLKKALVQDIEGDWMFKTTLKNLGLILDVRKKRNVDVAVPEKIIPLLKSQIKNTSQG